MGGRFTRVNSWDVGGWNEEVVSFIGDNIKIYGRFPPVWHVNEITFLLLSSL